MGAQELARILLFVLLLILMKWPGLWWELQLGLDALQVPTLIHWHDDGTRLIQEKPSADSLFVLVSPVGLVPATAWSSDQKKKSFNYILMF